jgi:hypothetical protein
VLDAAGGPGEALLGLLFGDRPWTLDQARRILALLGKEGTEAPAVARRIEDTVLAEGDEEGVEAYARFCLGLRPTGLYPRLGGPARTRVDLMAELSGWIDRLAGARKEHSGPLTEFRKWTAKHDAAEQRLIEAVLAARFDDFYASVRARLLVDLPGVRHSYCAGLSKSLSRRTIDFEIAATALLTLAAVARMNPAPPVRAAVAELDAVLRRSVGRWNGRTQQRLLEVLALDARPASVTWIDRWMRQQPPGILGRMRGLFGAGRGADESAGAGRRGL